MTVSKSGLCTLGAVLCKTGLYLIVLGIVGQVLHDFFYVRPNDRLYFLALAFVLTLALWQAFRAMARQTVRIIT